MNELSEYLEGQKEWSLRTFGDGKRTLGIIKHIGKELDEVMADPSDSCEWIDIIILALDGYWRHSGSIELIMQNLINKQRINFQRVYPKPESEDEATEHERHIYDKEG